MSAPVTLRSYMLLLLQVSRMDIRKRYLGTVLGSVWAIISPLFTIGLIYVVMTYGLKVSVTAGDQSYINWLVSGMLAWFFLLEVLSTGVSTIRENSHLVTKIRFPLHLLLIAKVVSAIPIHILLMLLFMLLLSVQGEGSFAYWIQLPYYFGCATLLTLGINYLTASAQVFTRDIGAIVGVLLQGLFWATPIFWREDLIADSGFSFLLYSPFAYIITGYRDSLFDAVPFWHRPAGTAIFWSIALFTLWVGMAFFRKMRPHFADVL